MKSLLIIGAGGYGRLVKEIAEMNGYDKISFLDDNNSNAIGKIIDLEVLQDEYDGAIVAIGNPAVRESISKRITNPVTLIHPNAVISPSAYIGKGCVIEANAVINAESKIFDGTFVCAGSVVNHDACVQEYCQVDCNAVVYTGACVEKRMKIQCCTVYI